MSEPSQSPTEPPKPASTPEPAPTPASSAASGPPAVEPARAEPAVAADGAAVQGRGSRLAWLLLIVLAGGAALASALLWQRLSTIQEQLARQSADSGANAIEARALARQAEDLARSNAARQAVLETRLGEVALQRTQLEDLMQSLSRSRDENLLVDVESSLRLAQQQSQLTASPEPLLAALRTADQRLARAAQPRLARLRAAIARDIDRIKAAETTDLPSLLARLDDLVRQVDDLPVANAVPAYGPPVVSSSAPTGTATTAWWRRGAQAVAQELRGLVRVSRIESPDAALLAPEQAFFLRENLKLKLLNARLSLLARQPDTARADVAAAAMTLYRYFDPASRRTQAASGLLQQVQAQLKAAELPRIDETLAVLAAATANR